MRLRNFDIATGIVNGDISGECYHCRRSGIPNRPHAPQSTALPHPRLRTNTTQDVEVNQQETTMGDTNHEDAANTPAGKAEAAGKPDDLSQHEKQKAATMIQRNYRGYRERRQIKGLGMSASMRWSEAISELRYRERTRPKSREQILAVGDSHTRARDNWHRLGAIASRAAADDLDDESEDVDSDGDGSDDAEKRRKSKLEAKAERAKNAKQMDLQYWLEMVDGQHRYGSHLRAYHQVWQQEDTHENFFYWLDHGEGKHLDLPIVSRKQLDADKVRYLSREERQNYLVRIDKEGRLCWAHNGIRITTSTAYKDSVDGIVPKDDVEHQPWALPVENPGTFSSDESDTMSTGHMDDTEAQHYVNHDLRAARGVKKLKYVSAATILNHLLQKSVKPNSWIFVADTSFRLYVGIKQSGAFQHSSFLHGSRISAAGLIKIKDGQLRKLSPLSGHYRPPTKNFRLFVHSMKDAGVDMSRVSISQSYAILVGLEAYVRTRRKFKHGVEHVEHGAEKVVHPEEAKAREQAAIDNSESAAKERQFIEKHEHKQKEHKKKNSLPYRIMNRLKGKTSASGSVDKLKTKTAAKVPSLKDHAAPHSTEPEDPESGVPPEGSR